MIDCLYFLASGTLVLAYKIVNFSFSIFMRIWNFHDVCAQSHNHYAGAQQLDKQKQIENTEKYKN